ncbi:MAG: anhydro-N-acetylmuramic acid kinase [Clostridia bacterium]|nr:anhydro-N-acetylmuramic acid kinase [Clostridia bacterium]
MAKLLHDLLSRDTLTVIGLMSGTSADGLDAALCTISGSGTSIRVRQEAFPSLPYTDGEHAEILRLASGEKGGSHDLALFHFWLGQKSVRACRQLCEKAGIAPDSIDLIGSHGQTLWHIPVPEDYLGSSVTATLQLGEASLLAEVFSCPVVSDFRVRDMAAGGQGAPLVPYTEYLLYRSEEKHVGLQNIGGIGNITVLPKGAALTDVFAFDTGPGNMVMDRLTEILTEGRLRYDDSGALAAAGCVSETLLRELLLDPYYLLPPPKTTGREKYDERFVQSFLEKANQLALAPSDILATATALTARSIDLAVRELCHPRPDILIVGGGGSRNPTLLRMLSAYLPIPVVTNESLGYDSEAKEAVAFAMLASECIHGTCNNVPRVTGASHPVVMGKISL